MLIKDLIQKNHEALEKMVELHNIQMEKNIKEYIDTMNNLVEEHQTIAQKTIDDVLTEANKYIKESEKCQTI